jgi:chaperonin cofactor prefoldin
MTHITKLQIGIEVLQSYDRDAKVYAKDGNLMVRVEIESVREEDRQMLYKMGWFTTGRDLFCFKTN